MFVAVMVIVVIAVVLLACGPSPHITLTPPRPCDDVVAFVDGELPRRRARRFRRHLRSCEACGAQVVAELQLGARLSTLPTDRDHHAA